MPTLQATLPRSRRDRRNLNEGATSHGLPEVSVAGHVGGATEMVKFLLWCILFVLCWPLALLALILYPIVWLLLLPFRLIGIAVGGILELVWVLITLPAHLLKKIV